MKPTIILMTILIACVNIGRAEKAQTTMSVLAYSSTGLF
jgi:hypothetical protein